MLKLTHFLVLSGIACFSYFNSKFSKNISKDVWQEQIFLLLNSAEDGLVPRNILPCSAW